MVRRNENDDWAQQVPDKRWQGPYRDYGWERGESGLPEFRDPDVHMTPQEHRLAQQERHARGRNRQYGQNQNRGQGYWSEDWEEDYNLEDQEGFTRGYGYGYSYTPGNNLDWNVPGPYAGIGPRGYTRSRERIFEDVCERLTQHGQIDASNVQVDVNQDGEVTLKGSVEDRRTKRMIEDIVDSVPGVRDVLNELRINRQWRGRQVGRSENDMYAVGKGRIDRVGGSGVYPASGPLPPEDAKVQPMASWGQGERGAEGYYDSGSSELHIEKDREEEE